LLGVDTTRFAASLLILPSRLVCYRSSRVHVGACKTLWLQCFHWRNFVYGDDPEVSPTEYRPQHTSEHEIESKTEQETAK